MHECYSGSLTSQFESICALIRDWFRIGEDKMSHLLLNDVKLVARGLLVIVTLYNYIYLDGVSGEVSQVIEVSW